jgi:sorting nexin-7/30
MKLSFDENGIECSVLNPEKHGDTINSYITFEIVTKTNWEKFEHNEFFVRRRFNDFLWLRSNLCEKFPNVIVPPLPDKEIVTSLLDKFSQDFLEKRRAALQSFLNRCLDHPKLRESPSLVTFLEAKIWALDTVKGQTSAAEPKSYIKQVYQSVSSGVDEAYQKYRGNRDVDPDHDKFENHRNYVSKFEEHLTRAQEVSRRLTNRQREICTDYTELGPAFNLLAQSEEELCNAFAKMGECSETVSSHYERQADEDEAVFVEPLKEYVGLTQSAKELLKNRDAAMNRYFAAMEALENYNAELIRLKAARDNPQQKKGGIMGMYDKMFAENPAEGVTKTEQKIEETKKLIEKSKVELAEMGEDVTQEMERFHKIKCTDFKKMMLAHVRAQVQFHQKVQDTWTSLLPHIQAIEAGHSTNPTGSSILGMASTAVNLN